MPSWATPLARRRSTGLPSASPSGACAEGSVTGDIVQLEEHERELVRTVADFVDRRVKPVVRDLEHDNTYPEVLIDAMKEIGIYGLAIPEPYGAGRVSMPWFALVTEELARGWMSLAGAMGGHSVVATLIVRFGTAEQKGRYLPRMATGEVRANMALTEP